MDNHIKAFILGTTILISVFPYSYLGIPHTTLGPLKTAKYEYIVMTIPLIFGLANVVTLSLPIQNTTLKYIIGGTLTGLILSLIGRYWLDIPAQLFPDTSADSVHVIAPILYALVFVLILQRVNLLFGLS